METGADRTSPPQERGDDFASNIIDIVIRVAALCILLYWSFKLIQPFITLLIWSSVLAIALYPIFEWLSAWLNNRRKLAALLLTAANLFVVLGPLTWLTINLIGSLQFAWGKFDFVNQSLPSPPASIRSWPIIGEQLFVFWDLASTNLQAAAVQLAPSLKPIGNSLLKLVASASTGSLTFLASIVVAGFLFPPAPVLSRSLRQLFRRLNPKRSEVFTELATSTIRIVASGVIGVSLLQTLLAAVGLVVAGIPAPALFCFFILILGIVQIGPTVILIPIVIWSWWTMDTSSAAIFTIYMVLVGVVDNILRPLVMARGLRTPIPVTLIGVLGGILAYGITGLFLGPIVLAVVWELCSSWIAEERSGASI